MSIKVNKNSSISVSISLDRVLELVRNEINHMGSKETGTYINVPEGAVWEITGKEFTFHWSEKS